MKRLVVFAGLVGILGFGAYLVLTAPSTWDALHPTRDVADAGPLHYLVIVDCAGLLSKLFETT